MICGMRRTEEGDEVVLVDPAWQAEHPGQQFEFAKREAFEAVSAGQGLLVKRVYSWPTKSAVRTALVHPGVPEAAGTFRTDRHGPCS